MKNITTHISWFIVCAGLFYIGKQYGHKEAVRENERVVAKWETTNKNLVLSAVEAIDNKDNHIARLTTENALLEDAVGNPQTVEDIKARAKVLALSQLAK